MTYGKLNCLILELCVNKWQMLVISLQQKQIFISEKNVFCPYHIIEIDSWFNGQNHSGFKCTICTKFHI